MDDHRSMEAHGDLGNWPLAKAIFFLRRWIIDRKGMSNMYTRVRGRLAEASWVALLVANVFLLFAGCAALLRNIKALT
jgi:hypothetical protein